MVLKGPEQDHSFPCHKYVLVCSRYPSPRSHLQYQRVRVYFGLNKNEACEKLTHRTVFVCAGTTVFSISSLKPTTGKRIKKRNSFILNMLYNLGLCDQEMQWKSHFCRQACSSLWWVLPFTLCCWGSLVSNTFARPLALAVLYLDMCRVYFVIICKDSNPLSN